MSHPICPLFDRILACRFGATREAFGSSKVWLDVFVYLFVLYLAVRESVWSSSSACELRRRNLKNLRHETRMEMESIRKASE